ncbi:hypothetical protein D3C71_1913220 [compost metagenome]
MLKQSTYYLMDAYRSEGLTKEQAAVRMMEDIQQIQESLAKQEVIPRSKVRMMSNPIKIIDDILGQLKLLNSPAKEMIHRSIVQNLTHLKSILK